MTDRYEVDAKILRGRFVVVFAWLPGGQVWELLVGTAIDRTVLRRSIVNELVALSSAQPLPPAIPLVLNSPQATGSTILYRIEDGAVLGDWLPQPVVVAADELTEGWLEELDIDGILGMDWVVPRFGRMCLNLVAPLVELWGSSDSPAPPTVPRLLDS